MKPPKDITSRLIGFVLGLLFLAYAVVGIERGHIPAGRRGMSHEIYVTEHPGAFWFWVIIALLLGGFFIFSGITNGKVWTRSPRRGRKRERDEAAKLGITVTDVERDLPEFSRGNRTCQLVRGSSARYSLPRQGEGTRSGWSLLQRTEHEGAQLPNGYLLQGEVSDALREFLTRMATKFSEEYFEFEGTATDVAVYWEEWGGASEVRHMHRILKSLAEL